MIFEARIPERYYISSGTPEEFGETVQQCLFEEGAVLGERQRFRERGGRVPFVLPDGRRYWLYDGSSHDTLYPASRVLVTSHSRAVISDQDSDVALFFIHESSVTHHEYSISSLPRHTKNIRLYGKDPDLQKLMYRFRNDHGLWHTG